MMRNIVGSWLLAAFLVVVAVATWRLLDAGRACHACPHAAHAVTAAVAAPAPAPVQQMDEQQDVEPVHTCGAGSDALNDPFVPSQAAPEENAPGVAPTMCSYVARVTFESAVNAFRAHDSAKGCAKLREVIDGTDASSDWHDKAARLFAVRCR